MTIKKRILLLILLGMAGGTIYDFPYIKYIFYNQMLSAMNISNTQLGLLSSVFGIICLILYIPGGILADKLNSKHSLTLSLLGTAALAGVFALTLNFYVAIAVWLMLAFTSGFVFWSALIKLVRVVGGEKNSGRMFGIYYASNGLSAALLNFGALWVYGLPADKHLGMVLASLTMAVTIACIAILLFFLLPKDIRADGGEEKAPSFRDISKVFTKPTVWAIAVVFFMTYALFSSISYLTPYLTDVVGISTQTSSVLGVVRNYVFLLLAPVSGLIADKIFKSTLKWFMVGYFVLAIVLILISTISGMSPMLVALLSLIPGVLALGLYGIQFSIISECNIPVALMGATTGFVSLIAYLPDLVLPAWFGKILDTQKNAGYHTIFLILALFAVVVCLGSVLIYRMNSAHTNVKKTSQKVPGEVA